MELQEIAVENNIVIVHPKSRQHVKENMSFTVLSLMNVLMLELMNAWVCLGVVTPQIQQVPLLHPLHLQLPHLQYQQYQQHQPLQFHLLTAIQYVEIQIMELLEIVVENSSVIVHPKSQQHVKENMSFTVTK